MIYDILPVNNYQGNGTNTHFDFDFYIEKASQLNVYFFDENNIKSKLQYGIDYSINEFKNPEGSYITFPIENSNYEVLSSGQKISLELTLPVSQETQYNNSSLLNLEALEYSFDYLTRLIQILARKLTLCVKVEECSSVSPDELISQINAQASLTQSNLATVQNYANQLQILYNNITSAYSNAQTDIGNQAQEALDDIDEKSDTLLDAIEENMNIISSLEENKANIDLSNVPASKGILIESYSSGASWYRVYSDGFCIQGGKTQRAASGMGELVLLKAYKDTNFNVCSSVDIAQNTYNSTVRTYITAVDKVMFNNQGSPYVANICWTTFGYVDLEE